MRTGLVEVALGISRREQLLPWRTYRRLLGLLAQGPPQKEWNGLHPVVRCGRDQLGTLGPCMIAGNVASFDTRHHEHSAQLRSLWLEAKLK